MGRGWGNLALACGLATAALLTYTAIERRQAELAAPLWAVTGTADRQAAVGATGLEPSAPLPAVPGDTVSAKSAGNTAELPTLLALDPRTGLAVLQSTDASTHTLARGNALPASPWRMADIGPDFVELSGHVDGSRQRLRLYRQDLHRPHRLISDRVIEPTVERMILLPLQPHRNPELHSGNEASDAAAPRPAPPQSPTAARPAHRNPELHSGNEAIDATATGPAPPQSPTAARPVHQNPALHSGNEAIDAAATRPTAPQPPAAAQWAQVRRGVPFRAPGDPGAPIRSTRQ